MKKILYSFFGLIAALLVIAMALPYLISGDRLKPLVNQKLQEATGLAIRIDGPVRLKFFPIAGVHAETITVPSTGAGNEAAPLMKIGSIRIDVQVIPYLLKREIVVSELALDNADIRLKVAQNGIKNWQLPQAKKEQAQVSAPAKKEKKITLPANILLGNVAIHHANIHYDNAQTHSALALQDGNLDIKFEGIGGPVTLSADAKWNNKLLTAKAKLTSLQSLLSEDSAGVEASITSDLLTAEMNGTYKNMQLLGELHVQSPSLKDTIAWLQPSGKPLDVPAPLALQISGDLKCSAKECGIIKSDIIVDKFTAKGSVNVVLASDIPEITADLATGIIDINAFLPKEKAAINLLAPLVSDATAATSGFSTATMDFSVFKMLRANLNLKAQGVIWQKIQIGSSAIRVKAHDGNVIADVVDADFYSGKANLTLTLDSTKAPAVIMARATMKAVDIAPLLHDAADFDRLLGHLDLQTNVASSGNSAQALVSALSGTGQVKLSDGAYKGVNIANMVRNAQALLRGVAASASEKTDFSELSGSYTITQGIVSNKDLTMKSPFIRLSGMGTIDLPNQMINYRLNPEIVDTKQGQNGKNKQGIVVPIIVSGALDHPTFQPDLASVINNPQAVESTVNTIKKKIKDSKKNLKDIQELLKGF